MTGKSKTPKYVTIKQDAYDPYITLKKVLLTALIVGVIQALTYLQQGGLAELLEGYPEYGWIVTIAAVGLAGIINYLKHYKDTELVEVLESDLKGDEVIVS